MEFAKKNERSEQKPKKVRWIVENFISFCYNPLIDWGNEYV